MKIILFLHIFVSVVLAGGSNPLQHTIKMKIDHYQPSLGTFDMRYIVDDSYFHRITNRELLRPVLFFMGDNGDIWE